MTPDLTKRAFDERIFTADVGPAMRIGDTVSSVDSVTERETSDLTIDQIAHTAATVSFRVAGGVAGKGYNIQIRFATNSSPVQMIETVLRMNIISESNDG